MVSPNVKLSQQADSLRAFACGGFVIGIKYEATRDGSFFTVYPNYPNPFNPKTSISYDIPVLSLVNITVYDVLGRKVQTLVNEKQQTGSYKIDWDAGNFPGGVYFYKFTATAQDKSSQVYTKTSKMVLLK